MASATSTCLKSCDCVDLSCAQGGGGGDCSPMPEQRLESFVPHLLTLASCSYAALSRVPFFRCLFPPACCCCALLLRVVIHLRPWQERGLQWGSAQTKVRETKTSVRSIPISCLLKRENTAVCPTLSRGMQVAFGRSTCSVSWRRAAFRGMHFRFFVFLSRTTEVHAHQKHVVVAFARRVCAAADFAAAFFPTPFPFQVSCCAP